MEMTQTTDVSTEKMRKDSPENTAEMTEPFNVVAEAAPTTLNKEEQANGEGEEEANENGNPPEPQLVKITLKLMRTVDKKVDQLDGRLAPLEEFNVRGRESHGREVEVMSLLSLAISSDNSFTSPLRHSTSC
ncbi:hypothetical protein Bca52824_042113 [Brassica carinata]|uniref:Uncharacterized protein n=1 Tax=Brassica carinata TaxID=52824 RepID=A0A8X7RUK5_BRACI|nr:hypothetical protein Bca52824_042113 [Brassica carinata]